MRVRLETEGAHLPENCHLLLHVEGSVSLAKLAPGCEFTIADAHGYGQKAQVWIFQKLAACEITIDHSVESKSCGFVTEQASLQGLALNLYTAVDGSDTSEELHTTGRSKQTLFRPLSLCYSAKPKTRKKVAIENIPMQISAPLPQPPSPRLLVLCDVGEEIDDEAALWLLCQHFNNNSHIEADVVFVTGAPMQRATRWATILNSVGDRELLEGMHRVRYFVGPRTERHVRYRQDVDADELRNAGLADILANPFNGGEYDVVLQISPLGGFAENCTSPPDGPEGALGRINPRQGAHTPLHIIVGAEGATNFPTDALHKNFRDSLVAKGFTSVHVEKKNYMNWEKSMLESFPPKLVQLVLTDEWNKAVGRIPPFAAALFVRFRVNVNVNYDVVDHAFAFFENAHRGDPCYGKAEQWLHGINDDLRKLIMVGYVKKSREHDTRAGDLAFGNPPISENIKGMKFTWQSLLSRECIKDLLASGVVTEASLPRQLVDDIMGYAVAFMTRKLLMIYAFNAFCIGREPDLKISEPYLLGTQDVAPLDFRNFPQLSGDISEVQNETVGNPMYDPAGMLVALVALSAAPEQIGQLVEKLKEPAALLDSDKSADAMKAAFNGEAASRLVKRYFRTAIKIQKTKSVSPSVSTTHSDSDGVPSRRLLVLTDAGEEADNEAALWLLSRYLEGAATKLEAHVVFTTGKPLLRAMRWAKILNSLGAGLRPGEGHIKYFVGPETSGSMRYYIELSRDRLLEAGMGDLDSSHFMGGDYDVILQASPLDGFSDNFSTPLEGPEGALTRINVRSKKLDFTPLLILVGKEGGKNCPKNRLHTEFRSRMTQKGFKAVSVEDHNYLAWDRSLLTYMPSKLVDLALDDEWNKAIGRIPPAAANLVVRFRVNTRVNYDVVKKAFDHFEEVHREDPNLAKANTWWTKIENQVRKRVMDVYVKSSRDCDARSDAFGNVPVASIVKFFDFSWMSVMSEACKQDVLMNCWTTSGSKPISDQLVDDVLGIAVTLTTGRLLRVYAYSAYSAGVEPSKSQCDTYITGSDSTPPLDFYTFPRMLGDFSKVKYDIMGNPMGDSSGMLLALFAMKTESEQETMIKRLEDRSPLFEKDAMRAATCAVLSGKGFNNLEICLEGSAVLTPDLRLTLLHKSNLNNGEVKARMQVPV